MAPLLDFVHDIVSGGHRFGQRAFQPPDGCGSRAGWRLVLDLVGDLCQSSRSAARSSTRFVAGSASALCIAGHSR
jgi:hypothetical protein